MGRVSCVGPVVDVVPGVVVDDIAVDVEVTAEGEVAEGVVGDSAEDAEVLAVAVVALDALVCPCYRPLGRGRGGVSVSFVYVGVAVGDALSLGGGVC